MSRSLRALLRHAPRTQTRLSSSSSSSVCPDEVSHFNALAADWWEPHGSSRLLHLMNPLRHDFIRRCAAAHGAAPAHALRYLDVGCGGGIFAESAARLPNTRSVTAIDPTPGVLAVAEAHKRRDPALAGRLTYVNSSIEGLAADEPFDVVSVFEVVEHVASPAAFLDEVARHVRPGGWLVMSTIARTWTSWVTTKLMAEEVLGIVPRGTHDWDKYVDAEELERYFALRGGWSAPVVQGVVYVPGVGWREVRGSERVGNYFLGIRKDSVA